PSSGSRTRSSRARRCWAASRCAGPGACSTATCPGSGPSRPPICSGWRRRTSPSTARTSRSCCPPSRPPRPPGEAFGVTPTASRLAKGGIVLTLLLVLGLAYAYGGRLFGSGNGRPIVSVTGTIEAIQVDVSAKITGRIAERPVNEGDRVTTGQLLVRLDDAEQAAEVRRQEAAVRTAQSTLNDLVAGARREELEDARAALQSAAATREWTERDFRRAEGLFRQALIAAQEVDRARQAYEVALAQEKSARQKLLLLEAGSRPDQIEAARGQLAQARNALDMARTRLKEMTIF